MQKIQERISTDKQQSCKAISMERKQTPRAKHLQELADKIVEKLNPVEANPASVAEIPVAPAEPVIPEDPIENEPSQD